MDVYLAESQFIPGHVLGCRGDGHSDPRGLVERDAVRPGPIAVVAHIHNGAPRPVRAVGRVGGGLDQIVGRDAAGRTAFCNVITGVGTVPAEQEAVRAVASPDREPRGERAHPPSGTRAIPTIHDGTRIACARPGEHRLATADQRVGRPDAVRCRPSRQRHRHPGRERERIAAQPEDDGEQAEAYEDATGVEDNSSPQWFPHRRARQVSPFARHHDDKGTIPGDPQPINAPVRL